MKILFIGPQGSGKSTQADLLSRFLGLPKISTGDIFRQISTEDSEQGKKIRDLINAGNLVDDETTSEIVRNRLQQPDSKNGFIFDGYPRNIKQIELFDPGFDKVIYLKVPEEEVIKRMMARGRADDSLESIKKRLDFYFNQTQPLLDYYKQKRVLIEVSGMGDIERIQDEIKKSI